MSELGAVWEWFADTSCRGYSPLYDRICRTVAADSDLLALVEAAPPPAHQPNVLLGAVHYLLLGGLDHPLGAVYRGTSTADAGPLFRDFCLGHRDAVLDVMQTRRTQTNEVGRCATIGPALTWAAHQFGMPLAHVDVGTSAGLNLGCDRYRLDYGGYGATGPSDAAVRVDCVVESGDPPIAEMLPDIAYRVGLDRSPVDVADADDARWLLACVWPDTGRLDRTAAAIADAQTHQATIVRGDMIADLPAVLAEVPPNLVTCVTTTWVVAYLSVEGRLDFEAMLAESARTRPLVWICAEAPRCVPAFASVDVPESPTIEYSVLGAVSYGDHTSSAVPLAFVHPHGASMRWVAPV